MMTALLLADAILTLALAALAIMCGVFLLHIGRATCVAASAYATRQPERSTLAPVAKKDATEILSDLPGEAEFITRMERQFGETLGELEQIVDGIKPPEKASAPAPSQEAQATPTISD